MARIPLVDLYSQYTSLKEEFDDALSQCIQASSFIGGPDHRAFAAEFASFCGGGSVALCGNGTDALYLALVELLGRGDGAKEVITVSHTFIATAEAITLAGYRPVFVDIDPETGLMDPVCVEQAVTVNTVGIVPVHLYGQMAPMDRIADIAHQHDLVVVEDAAQAHGAMWRGKGPGSWGNAACFSFYPGKNLGAWGDGGAVYSTDPQLIERINMRANHGRKGKYEHEFEGTNSRLDGMQASILRVKLRHLRTWTERRRAIASRYFESLSDTPGICQLACRDDAYHVYHLLVICVDDRDWMLGALRERGIEAGVHYPMPLHEQDAYTHLRYSPSSLPNTHRLSRTVLSLPLFPEMTDEQVERVIRAVKAVAVAKHAANT